MGQTYSVRRNAWERPKVWTLSGGELIEQRQGAPERRLALAELKQVRLLDAPAGYGRRQRALSLTFARGRASIGSHSYRSLAEIDDQTPAFAAFVRALCAEAALAGPSVRFVSGGVRATTVLSWVTGLVALGVVALLAAAAAVGSLSLGVDLASRLGFVLCLLLALRPWMGDSRRRGFDPRAIPAEVLP